jgi:hypothetical protein
MAMTPPLPSRQLMQQHVGHYHTDKISLYKGVTYLGLSASSKGFKHCRGDGLMSDGSSTIRLPNCQSHHQESTHSFHQYRCQYKLTHLSTKVHVDAMAGK